MRPMSVEEIMRTNGASFNAPVPTPGEFRKYVPERLRPFAIAYKRTTSFLWTDPLNRLEDARRKYDAGTHVMCQGRVKGPGETDLFVQYLIPRRQPVAPCTYFRTMFRPGAY